MIVQLSEATQYYYYRAVLAIFPLTPDQIRAEIWPNGVRGAVPDYLSSSVQACSSDPARIRLRSATSINYSVPRTRTKFGDRAFSVAEPVVWNSIPAAVRDADTLSSFKRKLKTHFFCVL